MSAALVSPVDRSRVAAASGLALVAALAWIELATMPMAGSAASFSAAWLAAFAMWAVMMTAMMLPAVTPMVLTFATVLRRRGGGRAGPAIALFVGGYLLAWGAFDAAATTIQLAVAPDLCAGLVTSQPRLAGGLLLLAGVYQLTPLKTACLRGCQSPLGFLLTHWREGGLGSLRMGFVHGAFCIGCCWALMGLMLVGGTMSLAWMAGLTAFVLAEKLAAGLPWLRHGAGFVLIAAGALLFVT